MNIRTFISNKRYHYKLHDILTITITGFVFIFLARAAYLNVFEVSERLDLAGDTHAI